MDHPILSADGHIDFPVLPETLWSQQAPAALVDRMPRVVETAGGRYWETARGERLGLVGGMGTVGRRYEPGRIRRADRMAATGLYEDQARGIMRTVVPELRIQDQQRDGLAGEVLYGILSVAGRLEDREAAQAVVQIYNEWLAKDFCSYAPERFAGIGVLSPASAPGETAKEVLRCAELGLRGVELGQSPEMRPLWHEDWDPVWQACAQSGLPLHVHTTGGGGFKAMDRLANAPLRHRQAALAAGLGAFQISMVQLVGSILFGGALERFPELRVVIGEAGIGWLPYALERFDYEWEDQFRDLIPHPPSHYWRRQMHATFQQDRVGLRNLDAIGSETVMWGADFPHPDGTWPDSQELIAAQTAELSSSDRRAVLYDNAARLYGFPSAP